MESPPHRSERLIQTVIGTAARLSGELHAANGGLRARRRAWPLYWNGSDPRQAEFARVARLTTMGTLTASIAHEINQPLAAITMGSRAGLRWLSKEPPNLNEVRAALENIARDGERAGKVIDSLRAMFKSGSGEKCALALTAVIQDILKLLHDEIIRRPPRRPR